MTKDKKQQRTEKIKKKKGENVATYEVIGMINELPSFQSATGGNNSQREARSWKERQTVLQHGGI